MKDMRSEKCKNCVHTKVCMKDLNLVGEMFVAPNPILGNTKEAWERYKEREAQGFPCEDRLEIVRCKDCRWFKQDSSPVGYGYCDGKMVGREVDYNDFCSWAKMKGGTE